MRIDLIIDGYNLLHFAGLARSTYGPGGLERARNRLLKRIQKGLTLEELARTTVVFDGINSSSRQMTVQEEMGIEVIYSPQDMEADEVIENLILQHSSPKQLLIISSDNRLLRAARRRRAGVADSESFLEELERRELIDHEDQSTPPAKPSLKQSAVLTDEDLAEWMTIFDDVDPVQISADLKPVSQLTQPTHAQPASPKDSLNRNSIEQTQVEPSDQPVKANKELEISEKVFPDDPLINNVDFWQQRIDEMYREEDTTGGFKPKK